MRYLYWLASDVHQPMLGADETVCLSLAVTITPDTVQCTVARTIYAEPCCFMAAPADQDPMMLFFQSSHVLLSNVRMSLRLWAILHVTAVPAAAAPTPTVLCHV